MPIKKLSHHQQLADKGNDVFEHFYILITNGFVRSRKSII